LACRVHAAHPALAQDFLVKYLETLQGSGLHLLEGAKEEASRAVIHALAHSLQLDNLLELDAVRVLAEDKTWSPVYSLLSIFVKDQMAEYLVWHKANGPILESYKLNDEQLRSKLRTLTICSMGSKQPRLTYTDLMAALQLPDGAAVEAAVMDAVVAGAITCKIDQENEAVVLSRHLLRHFTNETWGELGAKLDAWKANVHAVLSTLHNAQARVPDQGEE